MFSPCFTLVSQWLPIPHPPTPFPFISFMLHMAKPMQITGMDSQVFREKRFCWKTTANSTVISGDIEPLRERERGNKNTSLQHCRNTFSNQRAIENRIGTVGDGEGAEVLVVGNPVFVKHSNWGERVTCFCCSSSSWLKMEWWARVACGWFASGSQSTLYFQENRKEAKYLLLSFWMLYVVSNL